MKIINFYDRRMIKVTYNFRDNLIRWHTIFSGDSIILLETLYFCFSALLPVTMKQSLLVDKLSGVLLNFEIFGMQFFSLKSFSQKDSRQQWSIFRIVHIAFFCAIAVGFTFLIINGTIQLGKVTSKNVLTIFYLHLVYNIILAAFLIGFVQSVICTKIILHF